MRLLFVMDPPETLAPRHDSTLAMIREFKKRHHTIQHCGINDLFFDGATISARISNKRTLPLSDFDGIWMRKDPPVDDAYRDAVLLLDRFHRKKPVVFNAPSSLLLSNEKLFTLDFLKHCPETIVSSSPGVLIEAAKNFKGHRIILKPLSGFAGEGVFLIEPSRRNLHVTLETLTQRGKKSVILQEFLPTIFNDGDMRVIWVHGQVLGAIRRIPKGSDHRGNMARGAVVRKGELSKRQQKLIEDLTPTLVARGIFFAGLDLIGDKLTEINITSPTGLQEVDQFCKASGKTSATTRLVTLFEKLLDH